MIVEGRSVHDLKARGRAPGDDHPAARRPAERHARHDVPRGGAARDAGRRTESSRRPTRDHPSDDLQVRSQGPGRKDRRRHASTPPTRPRRWPSCASRTSSSCASTRPAPAAPRRAPKKKAGEQAPVQGAGRECKRQELVIFTRQLATMVGAGLALLESLEVLGGPGRVAGHEDRPARSSSQEVRGGSDLSARDGDLPQGLRPALRQHGPRRRGLGPDGHHPRAPGRVPGGQRGAARARSARP